MMDITEIRCFLGLRTFHLAGVYDAFSRVPLALQLFSERPHASDMARLFRKAARAFTVPKYLITDLGGEFTARLFQKSVSRLGARQRFASAENLYATARLERFWRTLKDTASLRFLWPLTIDDLERRLEPALAYYIIFRAHQGLRGATPLEAFLGTAPVCSKAVSAPRGRAGEGSSESPFTVEYLDPQGRRYPVLKATA